MHGKHRKDLFAYKEIPGNFTASYDFCSPCIYLIHQVWLFFLGFNAPLRVFYMNDHAQGVNMSRHGVLQELLFFF